MIKSSNLQCRPISVSWNNKRTCIRLYFVSLKALYSVVLLVCPSMHFFRCVMSGPLDLQHTLNKHRMVFYCRLVRSTYNFRRIFLPCYFGEHFLCDAELVMFNGKQRC